MSRLRVPHETEPVTHFWTAWPDHPDWGGALAGARGEIAALVAAAAEAARPAGPSAPGAGEDQSELGPKVVLLTPPDGAAPPETVRASAKVKPSVYGDIWLRDTGPVWALDGETRVAVRFRFNGWGGKYLYPGDHDVAPALARALGAPVRDIDLVAEGGAFEHDGENTLITTRACLLDRARNPNVSARDVEAILHDALGTERVLWLEEGLERDHTDGHADTLARFVRPGLVVAMAPRGAADPNRVVLDDVARALDGAKDAHGRSIDVVRLPSPGYVADAAGRPKPASHLNFVHVGETVIVPMYEGADADGVLKVLRDVFEEKTVIGLPADALVEEGGAFHCACNAAPASRSRS